MLGFLVYSAVTTPFAIRQMLRTYWNAPEAAERNKEVAKEAPVHVRLRQCPGMPLERCCAQCW